MTTIKTKTKSRTNVDFLIAQDFLDMLGGDPHMFQSFDDQPDTELKDRKLARIMHGTFDQHKATLAELNGRGAGVFVAMNVAEGGRKKANIKQIRAVSVDLDGAPVKPVQDFHLKPHMLIESSEGRYHAYWLVEPNFPIDKFEDVQRAIAKQFDGDPDIAKLTHCARLPGFYNCKSEDRFQTQVIGYEAVLPNHTTDAILAAFPPLAKAHRASISRNGALILPAGAPVEQARIFLKQRFMRDDIGTIQFYRDSFYEWEATHYKEREDDYIKSELYAFLDKAFVQGEKALVPFNPTRGKVGEILAALQSGVFQIRDKNAPFWLTADRVAEDTSNLIACRNGLLDITTRKLSEHTPNLFNVNALTFDYDPKAPNPVHWLKFLREILPNDQQARDTLQEIFGLMLTGDTSHHKIFMLKGPKRSGKGTIGRVLTALLGKDNVAGPTLSSLGTQFGLWPLIDKRVAIISDARIGTRSDSHIVVERLLAISGEDAMTVDRKHQFFWTGKLGVRFLILTNELPKLTDASGAMTSRFIPLVLEKSFYGKEDLGLTRRLLSELPGIFNWSLVGLDRLRERGHFDIPESSLDAIKQQEDLASPVTAFVRDWGFVGPDEYVSIDEFFKAYTAWCEENGIKKNSKHVFGRDLFAAFTGISRGKRKGEKIYRGLDLSQQGEKALQRYESEKRKK